MMKDADLGAGGLPCFVSMDNGGEALRVDRQSTVEHLPDHCFRNPERTALRRLGLSTDPAAAAPAITARERVLLYRLGTAIPDGGRVSIAGELLIEALVVLAAGACQRRGTVEVDRPVLASLPESLIGTVTVVTGASRGRPPANLLVLSDGLPALAGEPLASAAPGALVAVVKPPGREPLQDLVRSVVVSRQIEGGRTVGRFYWTRIDPSRQPRCSTDPLTTVIVPTHDREDLLAEALDSIVRQQTLAKFEVMVVENAPTARLEPRITDVARNGTVTVRHLHEPRPGLHRARHRGALAAHGSILVYVDDDVIAPPGWLEALVAPFADSTVAIAGGPVRPQWESPPPRWVADIPDSYFSLLDLGDRELELRYPNGAYGCNMAVRRDVLFEVGGFNPDAMGWDRRLFWLRGDGEDGLHLKVGQAGYRVLYQPAAGLVHRMPASRVTPRAVRRRGLLVGLSHSFASIRATPRGRCMRLRLLARAGRAFAAGLRAAAAATLAKQPQLRGCDAFRAFGCARQHLEAAIRPRVLRFITRPCFFTEEPP